MFLKYWKLLMETYLLNFLLWRSVDVCHVTGAGSDSSKMVASLVHKTKGRSEFQRVINVKGNFKHI